MSEHKWDKFQDFLFDVKIPRIFTRSIEDIRLRGNRISGIKRYDKMINNELMTVSICINKLLEHFNNRVPIILVNREDAERIYEIVQEKLQGTRQRQFYSINGPSQSSNQLRDLDEFASSIYNSNFKIIFKGDQVDNGIFGDKPSFINFLSNYSDTTDNSYVIKSNYKVVDQGDRTKYSDLYDDGLSAFRG